jgi:hypothetical protein
MSVVTKGHRGPRGAAGDHIGASFFQCQSLLLVLHEFILNAHTIVFYIDEKIVDWVEMSSNDVS